jgi:hypothetical protein
LMGRPRSHLQQPLLEAARERAPAPVTWRDLVCELDRRALIDIQSPAEVELVRVTVLNLGRRGELVRAQPEYLRMEGSRRPMAAWRWPGDEAMEAVTASDGGEPFDAAATAAVAPHPLDAAFRAWMGVE